MKIESMLSKSKTTSMIDAMTNKAQKKNLGLINQIYFVVQCITVLKNVI